MNEYTDKASFERAALAWANPELWEATVERSDKSLISTRFFLFGGATEVQALGRAWDIWAPARMGSSRFITPSLKVKKIASAPIED